MGTKGFRSITCLNDNKFWTCHRYKIFALFKINGESLATEKTLSVNNPSDITLGKRCHLVYTDHGNGPVDIFKNAQMQAAMDSKIFCGVCFVSH